VLTPEGRLQNPETGLLVGSASHVSQCVAHLDSLGVLSPQELRQACVDNPLRLLGMTQEQLAAD
jgi:N-acetylglucosamine-6-phosphate deacetylase